jgi:chorismate mutase
MTVDPTAELHRLRAAMDALNLQLRNTLQQRASLCREIARHKREHGLPLIDPGREAAMLQQLARDPGDGYSAVSLVRIFAAVLAESRAIVTGSDS